MGSTHPDGFERRAFRADHVKPRRTSFVFPQDIPKHWLGGSATRTHALNSLNLFFPAFERMILRMVRDHVVPRLSDPHLQEQARGFMGQEATHSRAHALFLENLHAQGYDTRGYEAFASWFFEHLFEKKLGTRLSLSLTAGFEHYTDLLVQLVLQGDFMDGCEPHMRELFAWHAAEEIEHNAVAYEMLRTIDDGYLLRMAGNVLAVSVLLGFMLSGMALLLHQDGKLFGRETARELVELWLTRYRLLPDIARLFVHYARPGYRPDDADYSDLAREVLSPEAAA
jgi:hypothetical protein